MGFLGRRGYESVFAEELKLLHAMIVVALEPKIEFWHRVANDPLKAAKFCEFEDYFGRFLFTCRDTVEELGPEPEVELENNWLKGSD